MKIARIPLLEALNIIKPALAQKPLIEELVHVWFDGKKVMAYNDAEMGIQAPLITPFMGGMNGALMIGLLSASRAKEVSVEEIEDGMNLKAGRLKADLSLLPLDRIEAVWQFPKINKNNCFTLSDDLLEAIKFVLVSVGKNTEVPETLGITFYFNKAYISLYTSNSKTMAHAEVDRPKDMQKSVKGRVILPTTFCEMLLRVKGEGDIALDVREDCVIAKSEEGVMIYARVIECPEPKPFPDIVSAASTHDDVQEFPIPEQVAYSLDQIDVILNTGEPGAKMRVKMGEGKMRMIARLDGKTRKAQTSVEIPEEVPAVAFRVEPDLIRRGLGITESMSCSEEVIVMTDKSSGFRYFIEVEKD